MQNMNRALPLVLALLLATLLAACQSAEEEPQSVEERAQARWDRIVERDFEAAWEYYSPGFREETPVGRFGTVMKRRPIRWEAAAVAFSECEGNRCDVTVDVTYNVPGASSGLSRVSPTRPVRETWIQMQDEWWYSPEN